MKHEEADRRDDDGDGRDGQPPTSLTRTTIKGAQLAGIGFGASQGLMFVGYVVLAHLISPTQFGEYSAATIVTGFGGLFAEGGMMAALINRREKIEEAASTAFFSLLLSGLLLTIVALALSPLIGLFFHSSKVGELAAALSGWLYLRTLMVVPDSLLQRNFSFARRVAVDPLGAVAFAGVSIWLGVEGAGYWALVGGAYASSILQVIFSWGFARFRPRLSQASIATWRELATLARPVMIAEIVLRVSTQVDTVVLGRFSGVAALGQYRNGMRLVQTPANVSINVVSYVVLPALAVLAATPERLSQAAYRVYSLVFAVGFPVSFAAIPLGVPGTVLILGSEWRPAGHAVAGLCGLTIGTGMGTIATEIFKVARRPNVLVQARLFGLVVICIAATTGAAVWGLIGVSVAISLGVFLTGAYSVYRAASLIDLKLGGVIALTRGPVLGTAVMVPVMLACGSALNPLAHPRAITALLLILEIVVGAVSYLLVLMLVDGRRRREVAGLLGAQLGRIRQAH